MTLQNELTSQGKYIRISGNDLKYTKASRGESQQSATIKSQQVIWAPLLLKFLAFSQSQEQ